MNQSTRRRLSATDWAEAALTAIGEGGLAAVAVEPLAARLGTTKGSFYWHFANREALIDAALERWEAVHTEGFIVHLEKEPDPAERLRLLLTTVIGTAARDRIEVSLLATAAHPQVAPVLQRVTARRIAYTARLFEQIGFSEQEAARRGLMGVSLYLGHAQIAHAAPDSFHAEQDYLDLIYEVIARP